MRLFFLFGLSLLVSFASGTPVPLVTTSNPLPSGSPATGTKVTYLLAFDNTGTTAGFGPVVDLAIPPGFSIDTVTVLGEAAVTSTATVPCCGACVTHPGGLKDASGLAQTVCNPGTDPITVLSVRLPFLGYAFDQPVTQTSVTLNVDGPVTGNPVTLRSRSAFVYGTDYLDNPTSDPPIAQFTGDTSGWSAVQTTTIQDPPIPPVVVNLDVVGMSVGFTGTLEPVSSTQYTQTINLNIPDQMKISQINVTSFFPPQLAFESVASITPALGYTTTTAPVVSNPPAAVAAPGNELTINIPGPFTPTDGVANDIVVQVRYRIPQVDASGADVINAVTGADTFPVVHSVRFDAFQLLDVDVFDTTTNTTSPVETAFPNVTAVDTGNQRLRSNSRARKAVALPASLDVGQTGCVCCQANPAVCAAGQKFTSGDTFVYTVTMNRPSDYFHFGEIVIVDTISDGQLLDTNFPPQLQVTINNAATGPLYTFGTASWPLVVDTSDKGNDANPATTGNTLVTFNVSGLLVSQDPATFPNGRLTHPYGFVLTYRALAADNFTDDGSNGPRPMYQADQVSNSINFDMQIVNGTTGPTLSQYPTITSATSFTHDSGHLAAQSVYAINGVPCVPQPCSNLDLPPGTNVTFRNEYELPTGDFNYLGFTFFLPDPLMPVAPVSDTFDPTVSATPPALHQVKFGPTDTFYALSGLTPNITKGNVSNRIDFEYDAYANADNTPRIIDILFTAQVVSLSDFNDGTPLNVIGYSQEGLNGGTTGQQLSSTRIGIVLAESEVDVYLAVTAATSVPSGQSSITASTVPAGLVVDAEFNGGACPRPPVLAGNSTALVAASINANGFASTLVGWDAGDLVTFAAVYINRGGADAFDTRVRGAIPAGFEYPAAGPRLCVTNGAGYAIAYTNVTGSTGYFDAGIRLADESLLRGSIWNRNAALATRPGADIVVVSYQLLANTSVATGSSVNATVDLLTYSGAPSGANRVDPDDLAVSTLVALGLGISVVAAESDLPETGTALGADPLAPDLAVGETIYFNTTVHVAEGTTPNLVVVNTYPAGMTLVDTAIVVPGTQISFGGPAPTPVHNAGARTVTWTFPAAVVNTPESPESHGSDDTDAIVFRVAVRANDNAGPLTYVHTAQAAADLTTPAAVTATAELVEPTLCATFTANETTGVDAHDPVKITFSISHCGGSNAPAYNVSAAITQALLESAFVGSADPAGSSIFVTGVAGGATMSVDGTTGQQSLLLDVLQLGETATVTMHARLKQAVDPVATVIPSGEVRYWTHRDPAAGPPRERTLSRTAPAITIDRVVYEPGVEFVTLNSTLAETVAPNVALGELYQVRATVRVMEGTLSNPLTLTATLPTAASKLDIVSAWVSSVGGSLTNLALAEGSSVAATDSGPADGFNDKVTFNFGTGVVNVADNVADAGDLITVDLVVRVVPDNSVNSAGETFSTTMNLAFSGGLFANVQRTTPHTIVEPGFTIAKTSNITGTVDAADAVLYTLSVTHTCGSNCAPAYDVDITDTLPSQLVLDTASVTAVAPGAPPSPDTSLTAGNTLRVRISRMDPGETMMITYAAGVDNSAGASAASIGNSVAMTYESHSADQTRQQYTASDTHAVAITAPVIDSFDITYTSLVESTSDQYTGSIVDTSVGEELNYTLEFTVYEGTTDVVVTIPFRDSWFTIVSSEVEFIGSQITSPLLSVASGPTSISPSGSDNQVIYNFGPIVNAPDNSGPNPSDRIRIVTTVRVRDDPSVASSDTDMLVRANLDYNRGGAALTNDAYIEFVEPTIDATKGHNATGDVDAGDAVEWQLTALHPGSSRAAGYSLVFSDTIDARLKLVPGSVRVDPPATVYTVISDSGSLVEVNVTVYPRGDPAISVYYETIVGNTVNPGTTVPNTYTLSYRSVPWNQPDSRGYTSVSPTSSISIARPTVLIQVLSSSLSETAMDRHTASVTDLAIGETVVYVVNATFVEGTTDAKVTVSFNSVATNFKMAMLSATVASVGGSLTGVDTGSITLTDRATTDGINDAVVIDLGNTVLNTPDNAAGEGDVVSIHVTALVLNDGGANNGLIDTDRRTTATFDYASAPAATASVDVEFVEPVIAVVKTGNITSGVDAGEPVLFTVTLRNNVLGGSTTTGPAYDVLLTDSLSTDFILNAASVQATAPGAGATVSISGNQINVTVPLLLRTETVTLRYEAVLSNLVRSSGTAPNTAYGTFYSIPSTTPAPALAQRRTYTHNNGHSIAIRVPQITTSVVWTSLSETGSTRYTGTSVDLAIGESATVEVTITLAEGTTPSFALFGNAIVPGGASPRRRLRIDSAVVKSIGGNVVPTSLGTAGSAATLGNFVGSDSYTDRATFNFGNTVNSYDQVVNADDRIVLTVNVTVPNMPVENVQGSLARLRFTTTPATSPANTDVLFDLVEPTLSVTKTANATLTIDAGDPVRYTVVVGTSGGSGPAYNVTVTDSMHSKIDLVPGSVTVSDGSATVLLGNGGSDTKIVVQMPLLDPLGTQSLTITYDAILDLSVLPAEVLPNTAYATADSHDSTSSERRVATAQSTETITIPNPLTVSINVSSTSDPNTGVGYHNGTLDDVRIGETIIFFARVVAAEGNNDMRVKFTSNQPGLVLRNATVVYKGSQISALANTDAVAVGNVIDLDFGAIVNTPDNQYSELDAVYIEVHAVLTGPGAIVDGVQPAVQAEYIHTIGSYFDIATVDVVEPVLSTSKVYAVLFTDSTTSGDAWDLVEFTVTISHTASSRAPAYDLVMDDDVSQYFVLQGSVGTTTSTSGTIVMGTGALDEDVRVTVSSFLRTDPPIVIKFRARLNNTVGYEIATAGNTADVDYSSTSIDQSYEVGRAGTTSHTTAVIIESVPVILMNISSTSNPETGSARLNPGVEDLTVGETVTFTVGVELMEGTSNIKLQVDLPTQVGGGRLEVFSTRVVQVGSRIRYSPLSAGDAATSVVNFGGGDAYVDRAVFDFGRIVNEGDNVVDDGDRIFVSVTAVVVDDPVANPVGTLMNTTGSVDYSNGVLTASIPVEIVGPSLTIAKANNMTATTGDAGDPVEFTVTLSHAPNSTGPAYDVNVTDALSSYFEMLASTVTTGVAVSPAVVSGQAFGSQLRVEIPTFDYGTGPIVIRYVARLNETVGYQTATVGNTAALVYDSDASVTRGRVASASDVSSVTIERVPNPALTLVAPVSRTSAVETGDAEHNAGVVDLAVGERVTYIARVTLKEGTNRVVFTVDMPGGPGVLHIVSTNVTHVGASITGAALAVGFTGAPLADVVQAGDGFSDRATFDFGELVNAGDNVVDAGDAIEVEVTAQVVDVAANADGVRMTSNATLDYTLLPAQTASVDVEIVEPMLAITKSANVSAVNAELERSGIVQNPVHGDVIFYNVTFDHSTLSRAEAFDIVLEDLLAPDFVLVNDSVTTTAGTITPSATSVIIRIPYYTRAMPAVTVTYEAYLNLSIPVGSNTTNIARLSYSSEATLPTTQGRRDTVSANDTVYLYIPGPKMLDLYANDPDDRDLVYSDGDTVTLVFAENTNEPPVGSKSLIDALFTFSHPVASDYTGSWSAADTLLITLVNTSGVAVPEFTNFTMRISGDLRNAFNTSLKSIFESPGLRGDWGRLGPQIVSLVANDPDDLDAIHSSGDTFAISFDRPTIQPDISTNTLVNAFLEFPAAQHPGSDLSGTWLSANVAVITIVNASTPTQAPQIGVFNVTIRESFNLVDAANFTVASYSTSPPAGGDWGLRAGPAPVAFVADDPDDADVVHSAGDTVTITFDRVTNRPNVSTKAHVDALLAFNASIGADYTGEWLSKTVLRITVVDAGTSTPYPTVGSTAFTVNAAASLKDDMETTLPTVASSPMLSGDWGLVAGPTPISVLANDPDDLDLVYSNGDTILIIFSTATNTPLVNGTAEINAAVQFRQGGTPVTLGNSLHGVWLNPAALLITINNITGATQIPEIGRMSVRVLGSAIARRDEPSSEHSVADSGAIGGDWGQSTGLVILSAVAGDPDGGDGIYNAGDTITITFSNLTNTPLASTKIAIDAMFDFSQSLGADYSGVWTDKSTLVITIIDATGAAPPEVGIARITAKYAGNIRDQAESLQPSVSTSLLSGSWGGAPGPSVVSVVASDPDGADAIFSTGDTITVTFDAATSTPDLSSKSRVDLAFAMFHTTATGTAAAISMGTNYSAAWSADKRAVTITITNATASTTTSTPGPFWNISGDDIDPGFTLSVLPTGLIRNANSTSLPAAAPGTGPTAPRVTGNWGPLPGPALVSATLVDPPGDTLSTIAEGDIIVARFATPTDRVAVATQADLDRFLTFRARASSSRLRQGGAALAAAPGQTVVLGSNLTGVWTAPDTLTVTVVNATGQTAGFNPTGLELQVRGYVRDAAQLSRPSVTLVVVDPGTNAGGLGPGPVLVHAAASDPDNLDTFLSEGDVITLVFDVATNRPDVSSKARIDALFNFSEPIGANYTGVWVNGTTLVITLHDTLQTTSPNLDASRGTVLTVTVVPNNPDFRDEAGTSKPAVGDRDVEGSWGDGQGSNLNQIGNTIVPNVFDCRTFWCLLWALLPIATILSVVGCCFLCFFCARRRRIETERLPSIAFKPRPSPEELRGKLGKAPQIKRALPSLRKQSDVPALASKKGMPREQRSALPRRQTESDPRPFPELPSSSSAAAARKTTAEYREREKKNLPSMKIKRGLPQAPSKFSSRTGAPVARVPSIPPLNVQAPPTPGSAAAAKYSARHAIDMPEMHKKREMPNVRNNSNGRGGPLSSKFNRGSRPGQIGGAQPGSAPGPASARLHGQHQHVTRPPNAPKARAAAPSLRREKALPAMKKKKALPSMQAVLATTRGSPSVPSRTRPPVVGSRRQVSQRLIPPSAGVADGGSGSDRPEPQLPMSPSARLSRAVAVIRGANAFSDSLRPPRLALDGDEETDRPGLGVISPTPSSPTPASPTGRAAMTATPTTPRSVGQRTSQGWLPGPGDPAEASDSSPRGSGGNTSSNRRPVIPAKPGRSGSGAPRKSPVLPRKNANPAAATNAPPQAPAARRPVPVPAKPPPKKKPEVATKPSSLRTPPRLRK